jgi:hypothetical protein
MNNYINVALVCRVCASPVQQVFNMGEICINDFPATPTDDAPKSPIVLDQCQHCALVQIRHTVDPDTLYAEHYWYQSGINAKLRNNLLDIAAIVNNLSRAGDLIIDIGANDGTLLSGVETNRYRIGVEPAPNLQAQLIQHCDASINDVWHHKYIAQGKAQVITAIGMFYDMDNPNTFIHSVQQTLATDGVFIAQLMTLAPMLREYDLGNICHEHLEFYSYTSLVELFERNGMEIYQVVENDIQGGSYQIYARHYTTGSITYAEDISTIPEFIQRIKENGTQLKSLLESYVAQGLKCYVYGASTKGNTMLQYWDLGAVFAGAAEVHPDKFGLYTVGTNIPIIDETQARELADVFFVPNFGFRDMFIEKESAWIAAGGRMVFAMPTVEVHSRSAQ